MTPITLTVQDDLRRSRLTSFFRPLLAIPHIIVLYVLAIVGVVLALIAWFCALAMGRLPGWAHDYQSRLLQYSTQVSAYLHYAVDSYPPFFSTESWDVTITVAPPVQQNRFGIFFRIVLAYPVLILNAFMSYGVLISAIFSWWIILFTGRVPRGLRNLSLYQLRVSAHVSGYLFLLTPQYPVIDPLRGLVGADQPSIVEPAGSLAAAPVAPQLV